jgi:phospholipase D1/2
VPSETGDADAPGQKTPVDALIDNLDGAPNVDGGPGNFPDSKPEKKTAIGEMANADHSAADGGASRPKQTRVTGTEPFEKWEREEMEKLLGELRGHLGQETHCLFTFID